MPTPPASTPVIPAPAKPTVASTPPAVRPKPTAAAHPAVARSVTARSATAARPAPALAQPPAAKTAAPLTAAPSTAAPSTAAQSWEQFFLNWPEGIPQRGIVVNQLGEQMPFKSFMIRDDMVLLERTNPDTLGARFLISPFSEISLVKLTDPINQATFEAAGYKRTLSM